MKSSFLSKNTFGSTNLLIFIINLLIYYEWPMLYYMKLDIINWIYDLQLDTKFNLKQINLAWD